MALDTAERQLLRVALSDMKHFDLDEQVKIQDALIESGLVWSNLNLNQDRVAGFTRKGMQALSRLASRLRTSAAKRKTASNEKVTKFLASYLLDRWLKRSFDSISNDELDAFEQAYGAWVAEQSICRTHVIPCTISPYVVGSFAVGPVRFLHVSEFPGSLTFPSEQAASSIGWEMFAKFFHERRAPWLAVIDVSGREEDQSTLSAGYAVDIALSILQLALGEEFRLISRSTARSAPVWRYDVWFDEQRLGGGATNSEPGRRVPDRMLEELLKTYEPTISTMGRRLSAHIEGAVAVPSLEDSWCDAAYWYHEALAEPLETIAIAKLETSIEILLSAESSSRSTARLLEGMDAFLCLDRNHNLREEDGVPYTVSMLANAIVSTRSQVLHGTWRTITNDLPSKGGSQLTFEEVENLVRVLLVEAATHLDNYRETPDAVDSANTFIDWVKKQHPVKA